MLSARVNAGGFGPGLAARDSRREATSEDAGFAGWVAVGVDGSLSPMAAVSGRKREAMTMRWLRKELIVGDVGDCSGNSVDGVVDVDNGGGEGCMRGEDGDGVDEANDEGMI